MVGHRNMAVPCYIPVTLKKRWCTLIKRSHSITPPSTCSWPHDLGKTSGWHCCSIDHWLGPLGYPDAALADADRAIKDARGIDQAATLMAALILASLTHINCGRYAVAEPQLDEAISLAEEKGASF